MKQTISLLLLLVITMQVNAQSSNNSISIKTDESVIEYNPMIFGQFIEHFDTQVYGGIYDPESKFADENGFRTDVINAIKELKVPIVRWPGGCFVSAYHWLDGVGKERTPVYDKAWQVEDPNYFGTDEFVKWCKLIGAEPYICTNAGTGTPEEMSDWVEYCNLTVGKFGKMRAENGYPEPHNVKYWSIGNENWGGHELGAKSSGEWGPLVRESAKLMRSVTNDLILFAAATCDSWWTKPLIETAGHLLDYISIHGYWDPLWLNTDHPKSYIDCMMCTDGPENDILKAIKLLDETGYRNRIKIAYDEWNLRSWHHPYNGDFRRGMVIEARRKHDINSVYTMADALFSACFLNACLRHADDVEIACFSPIVNTRGAIFVHPEGILKRSTFYVLKMYANMLEKNVVPVENSAEILTHGESSTKIFDAILTCNDDKTCYTYAIINKDPEKSITIDLNLDELGVKENQKVNATVLSGSNPNDYNEIGDEERVVPVEKKMVINNSMVTIPAHSLVFINID